MVNLSKYTCTRCKKEFDFEQIKYDRRRNIVCVSCLPNLKKIEAKEDEQIQKKEERKIDKFECLECRFKFKVRRDSQQSFKCPYCGKTKLMGIRKYKDENDLINDAMDPRFDY